jgi:hypothetical protein
MQRCWSNLRKRQSGNPAQDMERVRTTWATMRPLEPPLLDPNPRHILDPNRGAPVEDVLEEDTPLLTEIVPADDALIPKYVFRTRWNKLESRAQDFSIFNRRTELGFEFVFEFSIFQLICVVPSSEFHFEFSVLH